MADRLLDGPGSLAVFDPMPTRREKLAARGVAATSATGADALFLMVVDETQCQQALYGPDGAAAELRLGAVVVVMSTVGPTAARRLEASLGQVGVQLVDAPVSGGVARAGSGETAAGVEAALELVRPALDRMGSTVVTCEPAAGDAQSVKLVNQLLCGVHITAAGEALASLGLDPAACTRPSGTGPAGSFMLDDRGARMLRVFEQCRAAHLTPRYRSP